MEHFFESIEGWFNFRSIYDQALQEAPANAVFVEVGSWRGRSAAYMAVEIAKSGKAIDFYCIDLWHGSLESPAKVLQHTAGSGSAFPAFRNNLQQGGAWDLVKPIVEKSAIAANRFRDESVDFIMIDAAHDYASVREDVSAWLPKLKSGRLMAGDDADWPGVLIGVHESIPMSEITILNNGANWLYRHQRPHRGDWQLKGNQVHDLDYLAVIPYVNRPDLLERAVSSIPELWNGLVVIDQSEKGLAPAETGWAKEIAGVFRAPPKSMSFTQMMNWATAEARQRRVRHLVFMHNDAECTNEAAGRALEYARAHPQAGVVFIHYDAFAVFNLAALVQVGPWDETFRWYFADNDYYYRMKLLGWELANFGGDLVLHHGSQTLHSDPACAAEVAAHWKWHEDHYRHKWGGPTNRECHTIPYGGAPW